MKEVKWHLDLFSTLLSRKHSLHKRIGKKQYVSIKAVKTNNQTKEKSNE